MGGEPEPDGTFNMILWLLCMANPILNSALAMAMAMTGGEIFAYLKEYCENVFMNILTSVGDLIWTLIRVAILIAIYILFVITFLLVKIVLGMIFLVVLIFASFLTLDITDDTNRVFVNGDMEISFGYQISQTYNDVFDIYAPNLQVSINSTEFSILFQLNYFMMDLEILEFPDNILDDFDSEYSKELSKNGLYSSSDAIIEVSDIWLLMLLEIISNIGDGTGQCGAYLLILTSIIVAMIFAGNCLSDYLSLLISVGILILELTLFIYPTFVLETDLNIKMAALLGLGIGYIISGILSMFGSAALVTISSGIFWGAGIQGFLESIVIADWILTFVGIHTGILESVNGLPSDDLLWLSYESSTSITGGFIGLFLGIGSTSLIPNPSSRYLYPLFMGLIYLYVGLILVAIVKTI